MSTPTVFAVTRSMVCVMVCVAQWGTMGYAATVSRAPVPPVDYPVVGLKVADYLLSQQNADGMINDIPAGPSVNEDSNMNYALMGLAAAAWYTNDPRYLTGLERGIAWLAAREEMSDPAWRGSWAYAYASTPPYAAVPVVVGRGLTDVRGVDTTSALFAYLLYLHAVISGTNTLAELYQSNACAGLDFALSHNQETNGLFYSSWQKWKSDGQWHLWRFHYTADQADVYLGMNAGAQLYGDSRYAQAADALKAQVPSSFYSEKLKRYAVGREADGTLSRPMEGFNGVFPQGYLPWVFGAHSMTSNSVAWLNGRVRRNGSISGAAKYTLSPCMFALGSAALGMPFPSASLNWIATTTFDPVDGSVRDTASRRSLKFSNVAGFTIIAFLGFPSRPY